MRSGVEPATVLVRSANGTESEIEREVNEKYSLLVMAEWRLFVTTQVGTQILMKICRTQLVKRIVTKPGLE